jgi:hypothetical protein
VPVMADVGVHENDTSLDWRSCTALNLGGEAGRGERCKKTKRAAMNTRGGGIAEMRGKERLFSFVQTDTFSL